jgi:hypothetical protein
MSARSMDLRKDESHLARRKIHFGVDNPLESLMERGQGHKVPQPFGGNIPHC